MNGLDNHLDGYGDPGPVYADTDPCPAATQVGALNAWQHTHGVSCTTCGRNGLRFAWWGPGHLCGRCWRKRQDDAT